MALDGRARRSRSQTPKADLSGCIARTISTISKPARQTRSGSSPNRAFAAPRVAAYESIRLSLKNGRVVDHSLRGATAAPCPARLVRLEPVRARRHLPRRPAPGVSPLARAASGARNPLGYYRIMRHADVMRVLREFKVGVRTTDGQLPGVDESVMPRRFMLMQDPPNHTRLRRLVSRAFTPPAIERLRPHVEELVDSMLDAVAGRGPHGRDRRSRAAAAVDDHLRDARRAARGSADVHRLDRARHAPAHAAGHERRDPPTRGRSRDRADAATCAR